MLRNARRIPLCCNEFEDHHESKTNGDGAPRRTAMAEHACILSFLFIGKCCTNTLLSLQGGEVQNYWQKNLDK